MKRLMLAFTVAAVALLASFSAFTSGTGAYSQKPEYSAQNGVTGAAETAAKGAVADALFKSMLAGDPCTEFDTWVSAGVWTDTSSRGPAVKHSGLMVQIDVWNACETFQVDSLRGFAEVADVKLSGQHASAAGIVEVSDIRGNSQTLDVSVEWNAENAPPDVIDGGLPAPICTFQGNARARAATATGSVLGGTNYSPDPSVWADMVAGQGALCSS